VPTTGKNTGVDHAVTLAHRLEQECADAWPALVDVPLGQWRLRAAGGFTGRANSGLTTGDPGRPLPEALAVLRAFADDNGIPPMAHVILDTPLEPAMTAAGWRVDEQHRGGAESVVLTGPVAGLAGPVPAAMTVPARPPADWWPLAVGAAEPTHAQRRVLTGRTPLGFGTARSPDGDVTAVVRGAVVGDLLHIARLAVAPAHRRRGLATGLLAAIADWGSRHGAVRCALQVATHNHAAISLYTRLGCRPHHRYRYWIR
jgi:ribosomal protein S18 acetylase RimI-like enzyme